MDSRGNCGDDPAHCEQSIDCPVLEIREANVKVAKATPEERLQQRTVEQTDGMPVHADLQGSLHKDVQRHGRGEEAPVPQIQENCVEAMTTVAETRAADQPGVLIQGWESV